MLYEVITVVCSCVRCNRRKGGRTPEQASMKLIRRPAKPRWTPMAGFASWRHTYPEWGPFLSIVDAPDRHADRHRPHHRPRARRHVLMSRVLDELVALLALEKIESYNFV